MVADAAGVSRSAVSRAFTEGGYVDQQKKAKILKVAQQLGYRPNAFAASLQTSSSNIVAVLTGNMKSVFDTELVELLTDRLTEAGKWPIVVSGEKITTASSIQSLFGFPVDAMVVRAGSMDQLVIDSCSKMNIPLVFSGVIVDAEAVDSVACRNTDGTYEITKLLLQRGRKRFGWIDGPCRVVPTRERRIGVETALREAGIELIVSEDSDYTFAGGMDAARKILAAHDLDALICANDAMAAGALSIARDVMGKKVPEDISITGFDDVELADWPCFNLTTVRNPKHEITHEIMRLLEARMADPNKPSEAILVDADLVIRGTH